MFIRYFKTSQGPGLYKLLHPAILEERTWRTWKTQRTLKRWKTSSRWLKTLYLWFKTRLFWLKTPSLFYGFYVDGPKHRNKRFRTTWSLVTKWENIKRNVEPCLGRLGDILPHWHFAPRTFCPNFHKNSGHFAPIYFCIFLWHISGISWAYLGHISGISWAYLGHLLGISWAISGIS